jgi:hypothetical protein
MKYETSCRKFIVGDEPTAVRPFLGFEISRTEKRKKIQKKHFFI